MSKATNYTITPAPFPPGSVAPNAFADATVYEAWKKVKLADDLYHDNFHLQDIYLGAFKGWLANYNAGRNRDTQPPQPPAGYTAVLTITEEDNGSVSYDDVRFENGAPVCAVPDYQKLIGDPAVATPAPVPAPPAAVGSVMQALAPALDDIPVGQQLTMDDGSSWIKKTRRLLMGTTYIWVRVAMVLLCLSLLPVARAQVTVACSPEPPEVVAALHMKSVLPTGCFLRNEGPAPRTLNAEDVYIAVIQSRPIDPASAIIVLNDHQNHSKANTALKVITLGASLTGGVLAFTGGSDNPGLRKWGTGMVVAGNFVPAIQSFVQGEVPSTAPYTANLLQGPITLAAAGTPGATATKLIFCARQKAPQPLTVSIK